MKGIKTNSNLSKSELVAQLSSEFRIEKPKEEARVQYLAASGTLVVNSPRTER